MLAERPANDKRLQPVKPVGVEGREMRDERRKTTIARAPNVRDEQADRTADSHGDHASSS